MASGDDGLSIEFSAGTTVLDFSRDLLRCEVPSSEPSGW